MSAARFCIVWLVIAAVLGGFFVCAIVGAIEIGKTAGIWAAGALS